MSDRGVILARVRDAIRDVPRDEPAAWIASEDRDPAARFITDTERPQAEAVDLLAKRCASYRAHVTRCDESPAALAIAIAAAFRRHGVKTVALPAVFDDAWLPHGVVYMRDDPPLTIEQLDSCDAVLTGCAVAIAQTGTLALDAGDAQGRRVLTLISDVHICVVLAGQILSGVPEAVEALQDAANNGRPLTLISGPSATSDIELSRVEGVHGPRRLEVIVASNT